MPPATAGGKYGAMSAPLTYGIAAKAPHADCAAFFLNWVATNDKARTIDVQVGGSHPMGPADAFMPTIDASTVTAQTLAAGAQVGKDNGSMDFIANATGAIYAKSWTPNLQKLAAGQEDGAGTEERQPEAFGVVGAGVVAEALEHGVFPGADLQGARMGQDISEAHLMHLRDFPC